MIEESSDGDILLISGEICMDDHAPLSSPNSIRITSQSGETAVLSALELNNASITFSNILLCDSLSITGCSNIHLARGVYLKGKSGLDALSFSGSGTLIVESGCTIEGSDSGTGISLSHTGGEFYASIEGTVLGGAGSQGGAGICISPLLNSGALLISGDIRGGIGTSIGGHALNLYDLSGNAFVTVTGRLTGGSGFIGGDGIQLISTKDSASVGVSGNIKGGTGQTHGGAALILMNASGSSSLNLSGTFSGGDAAGNNAQPGTSLKLIGNGAIVRTRIDNCFLEDGHYIGVVPTPRPIASPSPQPTATPEPTPISLTISSITPLPEITSPADNIAYIITPEPPTK